MLPEIFSGSAEAAWYFLYLRRPVHQSLGGAGRPEKGFISKN
jgi:hypothetical protein